MYKIEGKFHPKFGPYYLVYRDDNGEKATEVAFFLSQASAEEYINWKNTVSENV